MKLAVYMALGISAFLIALLFIDIIITVDEGTKKAIGDR